MLSTSVQKYIQNFNEGIGFCSNPDVLNILLSYKFRSGFITFKLI